MNALFEILLPITRLLAFLTCVTNFSSASKQNDERAKAERQHLFPNQSPEKNETNSIVRRMNDEGQQNVLCVRRVLERHFADIHRLRHVASSASSRLF